MHIYLLRGKGRLSACFKQDFKSYIRVSRVSRVSAVMKITVQWSRRKVCRGDISSEEKYSEERHNIRGEQERHPFPWNRTDICLVQG